MSTTPQQPTSYHLGQHTLDLGAADAPVTIANETVALELEQEEAYRLYLALAEHFSEAEQRARERKGD